MPTSVAVRHPLAVDETDADQWPDPGRAGCQHARPVTTSYGGTQDCVPHSNPGQQPAGSTPSPARSAPTDSLPGCRNEQGSRSRLVAARRPPRAGRGQHRTRRRRSAGQRWLLIRPTSATASRPSTAAGHPGLAGESGRSPLVDRIEFSERQHLDRARPTPGPQLAILAPPAQPAPSTGMTPNHLVPA